MGLRLIKHTTTFDFLGARYIAFALSGLLILIGLGSLVMKGGPRYGIDFSGGMIVQMKFEAPVDFDPLREALEKTGLPGVSVQRLGFEGDNEYLVRVSSSDIPSDEVRAAITTAATSALNTDKFVIQRLEMVGPKVGADLRTKALEAMFYSLLLISIYISGRFEQRWLVGAIMAGGLFAGITVLKLIGLPTGWLILAALVITLGLCWFLRLRYALGAIMSLLHDTMITVGFFSLMNKEFDLNVIAALLTLIGYSLNDTIVVFDRIRENLKPGSGTDMPAIINQSLNQTLSRTILTSLTVLFVVLSLYFFGGGVLHDFSLALLIGVISGTYSTIYVASPFLLTFGPFQMQKNAAQAA
jgi:preprotein translocase subunit SecF